MEDMEVDVQLGAAGASVSSVGVEVPIIIPDSGSSTEAEEDEDSERQPEGGSTAPADRPRLAATQVVRRRRRARPGLRFQYSTQTTLLNRGRLDFLLRVSAGSDTDPHSGSTEEVSDSEEEGNSGQSTEIRPAEPVPVPNTSQQDPVVIPPLQESSTTEPAVSAQVERSEPLVQPETQTECGPAEAASATAACSTAVDETEEGEGETCSICFEPWTTSGEHRLATLRCGHLFGFTCIDRWLKGQGAKCPQCNKKAKRTDIVLLYARKLRALDNTEQESLKRSLEQEQSLRRKAELESAQCRLQLQVVTDECGKLRREVQELRRLMAQTASSSSQSQTSTLSLTQRQESSAGQYVFSKAVLVSQAGGCRVLSYCEPLSCLLASQPSPHATLVPGYGVKKISAANLKASHYVPIHIKQIRGLAFNRQQDSLLLSAALDNTLKLTSLWTNTVVQAYNTGKPVWSCCWCHDNNNYIYAGLSNGSILVYDTRDTSTHVQELTPLRSSCPVVSLSYLPRAASSLFPCGGLIAGSLEGGCFWEHVDGTTYRPHVLPLESGGCTDIQVEPETRHCLVTYRPGRANPSLRCVLMELNRSPQTDSSQAPVCSCSPVQTFTAGSSCKLLTKNAVFKSPAGESATLVCAGDEGSSSTMVWDAGSGALLQKLPADLPVLDICRFEMNQEYYLASLTEKMLKIYKWEGSV